MSPHGIVVAGRETEEHPLLRRVASIAWLLVGLAACGQPTKVALAPLRASPPFAPEAPALDGEPVFVPQRTSAFQSLLGSPTGALP